MPVGGEFHCVYLLSVNVHIHQAHIIDLIGLDVSAEHHSASLKLNFAQFVYGLVLHVYGLVGLHSLERLFVACRGDGLLLYAHLVL